jgi:hypothetical protein
VRHKRFGIDGLVISGRELSLRYCDLLVALNDGTAELDWECLASTNDEVRLDQGTHALTLRSAGREFSGDAILVRSDGVAHVLRGSGPLAGVADAELSSNVD